MGKREDILEYSITPDTVHKVIKKAGAFQFLGEFSPQRHRGAEKNIKNLCDSVPLW